MHSSFGSDPKVYSNAAVAYGEVRDGCLVRVHSRCLYSEVFDSRECDCGWQLKRSRELLTVQGGVLIYLDQEGRGAGLWAKANAYLLNNEEGLDTYEAYDRLGLSHDSREYADAVQILDELGLTSVRLLTNNPAKVDALADRGFGVTRIPLPPLTTPHNLRYLTAKRDRLGHQITLLARGDDPPNPAQSIYLPNGHVVPASGIIPVTGEKAG